MGILLLFGKAMFPFLKELLFGGRRGHYRLVRNKWLIVSLVVIILMIATHFLMLETLMSYDKKLKAKDAELIKVKENVKLDSYLDCEIEKSALTIRLTSCFARISPEPLIVPSAPIMKPIGYTPPESKLSKRLAKIHD